MNSGEGSFISYMVSELLFIIKDPTSNPAEPPRRGH